MGFRPTHRDENRFEPAAFRIELAWNGESRRVIGMDDAVTTMQSLESVAERNTPAGAHARTQLGNAQEDGCAVGTMFVFQYDVTIQ